MFSRSFVDVHRTSHGTVWMKSQDLDEKRHQKTETDTVKCPNAGGREWGRTNRTIRKIVLVDDPVDPNGLDEPAPPPTPRVRR
jgi:hypothetical protein